MLDEDEHPVLGTLLRVPERVDRLAWRGRVALLCVLAFWSWSLAGADPRSGEIAASFLHKPLLVFHEAGHLLFMAFGEWLTVAGGTLMQLLVPLVLALAFLLRRRDPFGAAVAAWLLGVSVLDVAPYVYDALQPQLTLLSGHTGAEGGSHDWIYLLDSVGWRAQAQRLGTLVHALGVLMVLASLAWAAVLLLVQRGRIAGDVLHEE